MQPPTVQVSQHPSFSPSMEVPIWAKGKMESSRSKGSLCKNERCVCGGVVVAARMTELSLVAPHPTPPSSHGLPLPPHFFVAQRVRRRAGHAGQALAQALYFGARRATEVDSQFSRRSGCNLLIKSVHHLPRVPPCKPRRPIRDLDPKTQLLLEIQLTGVLSIHKALATYMKSSNRPSNWGRLCCPFPKGMTTRNLKFKNIPCTQSQ